MKLIHIDGSDQSFGKNRSATVSHISQFRQLHCVQVLSWVETPYRTFCGLSDLLRVRCYSLFSIASVFTVVIKVIINSLRQSVHSRGLNRQIWSSVSPSPAQVCSSGKQYELCSCRLLQV